ncbi:hypothetical protein JCM31826_08150 [Thermaurantimonas aggregans]|uniref:Uncharacterized protein n=1 Tax=Thermaurantimonas aggregans TaxID=2173829 RepID=A0A401XK13_9FLAO|nr:hypothetical protein JCM31826_08150 [Thermaurantimonas aggregans]
MFISLTELTAKPKFVTEVRKLNADVYKPCKPKPTGPNKTAISLDRNILNITTNPCEIPRKVIPLKIDLLEKWILFKRKLEIFISFIHKINIDEELKITKNFMDYI